MDSLARLRALGVRALRGSLGLLSLLLLLLGAAACDSGGGDGDSNGGTGGEEGTEGTLTDDPVVRALKDAGDPLAADFGNALATCGPQSHNTTPDGWGEVAIDGGNVLCSVWTPPHWTNLRAGLINIVYNEQDDSNSVTIAGGTPTEYVDCTPTGVTNWALGFLDQSGCVGATKRWSLEMTLDIAGVAIPAELFVVSCTRNGAVQVGAYISQVHGTSPLCTLRVDGYMLRDGQVAANTCTLSQIINSLKCLEKGQQAFACTKPACSQQMKAQGHQGGFCNSFDECVAVD